MSTMSVRDALGYAQTTHDLLVSQKTALQAKKIDPTDVIADLATRITTLSAKDVEQENAKKALADLTDENRSGSFGSVPF